MYPEWNQKGDAMIVTAIKPRQRGKNRSGLFLDGKFVLDFSTAMLEKAGIAPGRELTAAEVEKLKNAEGSQRAMERAQLYLAHRPRSEREVRIRLERYGYGDDVITSTLNKLRKSGFVDDASFAAYWKQNRAKFNSRSARLLTQELKQKGIDEEIIGITIKSVDDDSEAYGAGHKKARSLCATDYSEFRKKMWAFLQRRGFDYEVIGCTVEKLWQEKISEGE